MKCVARIIIIAVSVAEGAAMTFFTSSLGGLGNAFGGPGDGAGSHGDSNGEVLATLIIEVVWLVLTSPYLCMAAGSLTLIAGKSLRMAYAYSLVVLSITTLLMLASFQRRLELTALGNVVAGALWAWSFHKGDPNTTKVVGQ